MTARRLSHATPRPPRGGEPFRPPASRPLPVCRHPAIRRLDWSPCGTSAELVHLLSPNLTPQARAVKVEKFLGDLKGVYLRNSGLHPRAPRADQPSSRRGDGSACPAGRRPGSRDPSSGTTPPRVLLPKEPA